MKVHHFRLFASEHIQKQLAKHSHNRKLTLILVVRAKCKNYAPCLSLKYKVVLHITTVLFQNITTFPRCSCASKKYCCLPFFPGWKRFAVPRDVEPAPPTPVRLFPMNETRDERTSGEVAPPAEQQPTAEPGREHEIDVATCDFCLRSPCITFSAFKPMGRGKARMTNHTKRRKDYKWFWRALKDCGLWENPSYLARKQELGA